MNQDRRSIWRDYGFWKDQVNKFFVFFLIVLAGTVLMHLIHHEPESSPNIDKAWQVVNYLLGLLSGLIYPRVAAEVTKGGTGGETNGIDSTGTSGKTVVESQSGNTSAKVSAG